MGDGPWEQVLWAIQLLAFKFDLWLKSLFEAELLSASFALSYASGKGGAAVLWPPLVQN